MDFRKCAVNSSYNVADMEVLCAVVTDEAGENLLDPGYQSALQLLLPAAVFSSVLAAGRTGENDLFLLIWQQTKQFIWNDTQDKSHI